MGKWIIWTVSGICFMGPILIVFGPLELMVSKEYRLLWIAIAPIIFVISFVTIAGLLSRLGVRSIKNGRLKRTLDDSNYMWRRVYSTPWTMLYYFTPVYFLVLTIAPLKKYVFRLFGYQGEVDFVVYPDTWLRDLPVLKVGKQSYLSNKSSIATNICLMDDTILVEGIEIGQKSCVGHGTLIGPGTKMGDGVELGANITSGIRVKYGNGCKVYEICGIHHGTIIEDHAVIEAGTILGLRSRIGQGVRIREASHIHTGVRVMTQDEADQFYSAETGAMTKRRQEHSRRLKEKYFAPDHRDAAENVGTSNAYKIKDVDD
jgi:carbonic anhydrase/acetyltransferase-like protein (isoleucine patch superfamily)